MLHMMEGECQGCHQFVRVDADDQCDANIKATEACDCQESDRLVHWWNFKRRLENVCSTTAKDAGFEPITNGTRERIEEIGRAIYDGELEKAQIYTKDSQVTIQSREGRLQLSRKMTVEIEGDEHGESAGD